MSFTVKELEAIVSSPLSSDSQKAQAKAALDKAKPAAPSTGTYISAEGKKCMSIDEMMAEIDAKEKPFRAEIGKLKSARYKLYKKAIAAVQATPEYADDVERVHRDRCHWTTQQTLDEAKPIYWGWVKGQAEVDSESAELLAVINGELPAFLEKQGITWIPVEPWEAGP